VLGVRPEHVRVTGGPEPGAHAATLFVEEPTGADVLVTVELGGQLLKARIEVPLRRPPGAEVFVRLEPDRLHFFDGADGRALAAPEATGRTASRA
jgi:multiple sugar transport system ATP-binding protein